MKKDWMVKESQLDDKQLAILEATLDKSCIITGCAGSGKSVLALIKAQRIQSERGNNYQVIAYTKALRSYMNAGVEELKLGNNVYYHHQWVHNKECASADYTIVDEVQDFDLAEIEAFVKATNKHFFFFGDTAQSIYEGIEKNGKKKKPIPVEGIKNIPSIVSSKVAIKEYELFYNYRLPVSIAKIVQHVGIGLKKFDPNTYKSREPGNPRFLQYKKEEQWEAIHRIISNKNLTDVAILLPDNNCVGVAYKKLQQLGNYEYKDREKNTLNFKTTNPKIMTYWSAKGLQFESVFLPRGESIFSVTNQEILETRRKALYVAMTRTYRDLYVLYDRDLPKPLSDIPSSLYKTEESDQTEDI